MRPRTVLSWSGRIALVALAAASGCSRSLSRSAGGTEGVGGVLRKRAESFIAVVQSADPVAINERLADGLEFKRLRHTEGEWYSFYWKGEKVMGASQLERYGDPKVYDFRIEEGGAKIRVSISGRHRYEHFVLTGEGVSYSHGDLDEVLADLREGGHGSRATFAVHWLANHPYPEAVPALTQALDQSYGVVYALRKTTFQRLERRADWERWCEANWSKSRDEWRANARRRCLDRLKSDDLGARIEGVKDARVVGGMEDDVRKALTFPDEAYAASVVLDENGYALVIANGTSSPALIAVKRNGCSVRYSMKPIKADWGRRGGGGGRASWTSGFSPESCLRVLDPGESLVKRFNLPEGLVPGDWHFTVSARDLMNGRTYKDSFDLTIR